jgi:hypothetical protein
LNIRRSVHDAGHPSTEKLRSALAMLYDEWGKPEQAERYREAE